MEMIKLNFFYIFTIQDTVLSYFSGIFTASAINIFTSQIPDSILNVGDNAYCFIIAAVLFIVISLLFIKWSTTVTLARSKYDNNKSILTEQNKKKIWYSTLHECGIEKKLCIIFILICACIDISVRVLLCPVSIR